MKIYLVGGAVRDKLMNRPSHDVDYVVTGADFKQLEELGYKQVGKNFPVFIDPRTGYEYALARKEIKTGPKHTDFKFIFDPLVTLQEDAERRDFTCNALFYDEENDQIIDYHNGQQDIEHKILRHINSEHFIEDPLRVLRMCRFCAQLDFIPAEETLTLTKKMVADGMLAHLSRERIWQEFFKALSTKHFDKFIITARQCGALAYLLPEVEQLFSTPERLDYHPEGNSGAHTLLCLQNAAEKSGIVKFAVLLHDIGKTVTPAQILPSHHGHDVAGLNIIKNICHRLNVPNIFKSFALRSCKQHMKLHLVRKMRWGTLVDFIEETAVTPTILNDFFDVCQADFFGRDREIPQNEQQQFWEDVSYLKKAAQILSQVKATDMPNFEQFPKDKNFAERLRHFKISILREKLG